MLLLIEIYLVLYRYVNSWNWTVLQENLDAVVKMKPSFLHLGEKGVMILCRFMSTPAGFKFLTDANYTNNELKKWQNVSVYESTRVPTKW